MTQTKTVPREPAEAMMQAAYEWFNERDGRISAAEGIRQRWRAMYDAAPIAQGERQESWCDDSAYKTLIDEIAALRDQVSRLNNHVEQAGRHALERESLAKEQQGEIERARADASRYRAIRNDTVNPMRLFACNADDEHMVGVESMLTGAALDLAIDAAIAAAKPHGET